MGMMPVATELAKKVRAIDWDFIGAWTHEGIHGLHWYPGSFIPQVASNLVRLLTQPGDCVLDPFCGCGTTLVEAVKLGRSAIGLDNNRVGVLAAQAKCTFFDLGALHRERAALCDGAAAPGTGPLFASVARCPEHVLRDGLGKWYGEHTLSSILILRDLIEALPHDRSRMFFCICLSHVLKSCCSQEKHWGWVADNVTPKKLKERDVLRFFGQHTKRMIDAFEAFYRGIDEGGLGGARALRRSGVLLHDCRDRLPVSCRIDAVVTSPPYPCVIDFVKAQRLSYDLFGWDFEGDRATEIGARWKRFRKGQSEEYHRAMLVAFRNIDKVLRRGGLVGLVIDETDRRRSVLPDAAKLDIARLLKENLGYDSVLDNVTRRFSGQRLLDRRGSRNSECIVVLRKP
jgi:hypothetical protein